MKSKMKPFFLVSLLLYALSPFVTGAIIYEGKNETTEFQVISPATFDLFNPYHHAGSPSLRFTFHGVNITKIRRSDNKIAHSRNNAWYLNEDGKNLNNESDIGILESLNIDNSSTFVFSWFNFDQAKGYEICFEYEHNNAAWFSTFLEYPQNFPLNPTKSLPNAVPFITGQQAAHKFGPILENLLFNTDGFAVMLNPYLPFFLRYEAKTANQQAKLCFSVQPNANVSLQHQKLSFEVIASGNIRKLYDTAANAHGFIRKPHKLPDERMFRQPIWNIDTKGLNQTQLLDKVKQIADHGPNNSQLILDNWEAHFGDFVFDIQRFPDPKKFVSELTHLGFLTKLRIHSTVSNLSAMYKTHPGFLIHEEGKQNLTSSSRIIKNNSKFEVINFDRSAVRDWLISHLKNLSSEIGVESYQLVGGEMDLFAPADKEFYHKTGLNYFPNTFTAQIVSTAEKLGTLAEVESGYHSQDKPIFFRIGDIEPTWDGLKQLISTALTLSIAGYRFIVPGTFPEGSKPTDELYIRWVQACTFLPSMQFSITPWSFVDNKNVTILTKKFIQLHQEHSATFYEIANHTIQQHGEPMIRPMWYLEPEDSKSYRIANQFTVGNDFVIAPVLAAGVKELTVYLPSGTWIDQHGKSLSGPGEFKVATPLEELAYFKRKF